MAFRKLITKHLVLSACVIISFSLILAGCGNNNDKDNIIVHQDTIKTVKKNAPNFNSDSCFLFLKQQVDFGPRIPNSAGHKRCVDYLVNSLKRFGLDVQIQEGTATDYQNKQLLIKNIIAAYNPASQNRILLCAHYDTRPFADRDIETNSKKPIDGAIDGASGVAVILEIARQLNVSKPNMGIDIIFFDAEDYGTKYCLGSMYWSQNMHKAGYYAQYAVLLDMVGAKGAKFPIEGNSKYYANDAVNKIWKMAAQLGYSDYFLFDEVQAITDDHVYVNSIAHIPCVDIIHMEPGTRDFGNYHHKITDNIEQVDLHTLNAVGHTLTEVIYSE